MPLGEKIEGAFLNAGLPAGSLIHSPRILLDYIGKAGVFEHGSTDDKEFMEEQERLNKKLMLTKNKRPDF